MNDKQHIGEILLKEAELGSSRWNWPASATNSWELWYVKLLTELLNITDGKEDRTGTGVNSISHVSYTHDLRTGFPTLRSRYLKPDNPGKEMVWMLSGSHNVKDLQALGVPFWNEFADETGDLGPVYGYLWRHWPNGDGTETDQIAYLENLMKTSPYSRRLLVNCWHPTFVPDPKNAPKDNYKFGKQALTPCHFSWTVTCQPMTIVDRMNWVKENNPNLVVFVYPVTGPGWMKETSELMDKAGVPSMFSDLQFFMRSTDTVLGLPANFNMYAHLAHFIAKTYNTVARKLTYAGTDVHIYHNHIEETIKHLDYVHENMDQVFGQVAHFNLKTKRDSILEYTPDDFEYVNYARDQVGPPRRFPIAV